MRILLTNDDGINSIGLRIVADWAQKLGEVTVVAPLKEQSGKSQSLQIHDPFMIEKVEYAGAKEAYAVDSTPADCVRFAVSGLKKSFDLVISGVNRGYNLSSDVLYSGTAGAASEAVTFGINAIALSTNYTSFEQVPAVLDEVYGFIMDIGGFEKAELYNVNVPLSPKGILVTKGAKKYFKEYFIDLGDGKYLQQADFTPILSDDLFLDVNAVNSDFISVSPLTVIRTDLVAFEELKHNKKVF